MTKEKLPYKTYTDPKLEEENKEYEDEMKEIRKITGIKKENESLSDKRRVCVNGFFYYGKDVKEAVKKMKKELDKVMENGNTHWFAEEIDKIFGDKLI